MGCLISADRRFLSRHVQLQVSVRALRGDSFSFSLEFKFDSDLRFRARGRGTLLRARKRLTGREAHELEAELRGARPQAASEAPAQGQGPSPWLRGCNEI